MSEDSAIQFRTTSAWPEARGTSIITAIVDALRAGYVAAWRDDPILTLSVRNPADDIVDVALLMAWSEGLGWQINRECERVGSYDPTMTSVGDRARLDEFIAHPIEDAVCVGACLPSEVVARVVEDFAANPTVLSGACDWVQWSDLAFPRED